MAAEACGPGPTSYLCPHLPRAKEGHQREQLPPLWSLLVWSVPQCSQQWVAACDCRKRKEAWEDMTGSLLNPPVPLSLFLVEASLPPRHISRLQLSVSLNPDALPCM